MPQSVRDRMESKIAANEKKYMDPGLLRVGQVDCIGIYYINLPEHHVYIDERSFFSKMIWSDRLKVEKEAKIEAYSK